MAPTPLTTPIPLMGQGAEETYNRSGVSHGNVCKLSPDSLEPVMLVLHVQYMEAGQVDYTLLGLVALFKDRPHPGHIHLCV